jgi:hypothetical protein
LSHPFNQVGLNHAEPACLRRVVGLFGLGWNPVAIRTRSRLTPRRVAEHRVGPFAIEPVFTKTRLRARIADHTAVR